MRKEGLRVLRVVLLMKMCCSLNLQFLQLGFLMKSRHRFGRKPSIECVYNNGGEHWLKILLSIRNEAYRLVIGFTFGVICDFKFDRASVSARGLDDS